MRFLSAWGCLTNESNPIPTFNPITFLYNPNIYVHQNQQIAHMCGVVAPAEFMPEALFDDLPDKYCSIR